MSENNKYTQKKMQLVVAEKYNEITFFEPTEHFYKVLLQNQYHLYSDRCRKKYGSMTPEQKLQEINMQ